MALPRGLITISEAAEIVNRYCRAGTPDPPGALKVPRGWTHSAHRPESDEARAHLQEWIAIGSLELRAIGGVYGRDVVIPPFEFAQVPLLKSLKVDDFTFLRPSHFLFTRYQGLFGRDLASVELGVDERQVHKQAKALLRSRRRKPSNKPRGRPSLVSKVEPVIREIVDSGKWSADKSQKGLALLVRRKVEGVSASTVTRVLDAIYLES